MSADQTDNRNRVYARVEPETHDRIEALRDEYPDANGARGSKSSVLRAFIEDGRWLLDPQMRQAIDSVMRKHGISSRGDAWLVVANEGLRKMLGEDESR